ncbi:M23 family metallopeptidase [Kribbella antibiotica]|uniref:M23 family metallopeptidase n=2 Tax=Kribbella antibiotica TaxID=190195 RepID=A0A4R4Z7P4_9ACTN|nr:M23 family metallopeptidase [Kribbella antibiotica]
MAAAPPPPTASGVEPVEIALPFEGRWWVRNSPARQVPSHGTDLFGGRYAIDFVGVDERHRTAGSSNWRSLFTTEPPELFFAFGRPVLAPVDGVVVAVHDGEIDHEARRSRLALVPYALTQASRLREGVPGLAGNHVVISLPGGAAFVTLCHLQAGSIRVTVGQKVALGHHIANCGNSGNSTQPHVHLQVTDSADLPTARGVPLVFRRFREWSAGSDQARAREHAVPGENAIIEAF